MMMRCNCGYKPPVEPEFQRPIRRGDDVLGFVDWDTELPFRGHSGSQIYFPMMANALLADDRYKEMNTAEDIKASLKRGGVIPVEYKSNLNSSERNILYLIESETGILREPALPEIVGEIPVPVHEEELPDES